MSERERWDMERKREGERIGDERRERDIKR
jgi:hypothetical protein